MRKLEMERITRSLSRHQLSEMSGVSYQTIADIELGRIKGTVPVWIKLARAFRVGIDDIYDEPEAAADRQPLPRGPHKQDDDAQRMAR